MLQPLLDEKKARLEKLEKIRKAGIDPYPGKNKRTHTCQQSMEKFKELSSKRKVISLAGRLRSIRMHGGSSFAHIEDESGKLQLFLRRDVLGEKQYFFFKELIDLGDFIRVKGTLFKTKKGEITLQVESLKLLAKALLPLPEKWHGLTDVELRYRKRYLDLLSNPSIKFLFKKRTLIIQTLREFFVQKGFLEVETPTLQPIYGGGLAKPFKTHHNALNIPLYLCISDEMYLKRLIVGGYEKVFEIYKAFRNEGIDWKHNPEFTILEAQTAYQNYEDGMDLIEECYEYISKKIFKTTEIDYQGKKINLKRPWKRITMVEAVKKETGFDYEAIENADQARLEAEKINLDKNELKKIKSKGEILSYIFEEKVEKTLIQPTIIYNYPIETSPLAKKCPENSLFTQRFEHFIFGSEHGNNYSELNDPLDLKKRFIEEKEKIKDGFEEAHQIDDDYLEAIAHGMPPVCGLGIGVDRLVMLLTNSRSIKEVIFFPTMKPENNEKSNSFWHF